jgi:hypothetical protein
MTNNDEWLSFLLIIDLILYRHFLFNLLIYILIKTKNFHDDLKNTFLVLTWYIDFVFKNYSEDITIDKVY